MMKYFLLFIYILVFISTSKSYSIGECDSVKACIGNALTLSVTSGKSAHYVDVSPSQSLFNYTDELTVEFWFKPQKQQNLFQHIAGIWGPAEDANDVWIVYIDNNDNLVFEINHPSSKLQSLDNTIAKTSISNYYDKWVHGAFVFDGKINAVRIYLNGSLAAVMINSLYPISNLKKTERNDLSLQIGSTNAVWNNPETNRTFMGQIDEFRIWNRVLASDEIFCGKDLSLEGDESGLILYHRYNEKPELFNLCDASQNGNYGIARSGASCRQSDRKFNQTIFMEPVIIQISDTLKCEKFKEWTFRVKDTSTCSKSLILRVDGVGKEFFKVTPNRINNTIKNQEYEFKVTFEGELFGTISPNIQIYSTNRCRDFINIPLKLSRISDLTYSKDSLGFDMLKALCIQTPHHDSTIQICNISNRILNINSITSSIPDVFQIISPNPPININPGECQNIVIRFDSKDTTEIYNGILTINTNDICNPEVKIILSGKVQEVIGIYTDDGETKLPPIDFGTVCVDFASDAVQYIWANLLSEENILVDTIIFPEGFVGIPYKYPIELLPETGYLPDYFRFYPTRKGMYDDSIIVVVNSGECSIRKPIYVKGYSYESELEFILPEIDFGVIPVGRAITVDVEVKNNSDDQINVAFYLKEGSGFFLSGLRSMNIPPNSSRFIPVTFNPSEAKIYFDEICFFENRCYKSACLSIKGEGIIERFSYEPDVLMFSGLSGCDKQTKSMKFTNITNNALTLNDFSFIDTSGKFSLVNPALLPESITIQSGESFEFEIEYSPNETNTDRVDRASIVFKTIDGIEWNLKIIGSTSIPKMFITQETAFGQLEIGDRSQRTILIENISNYDVKIENITSAQDFNIIYPVNFSGKTLKPRDTIRLIVEFAPTLEQFYNEVIKVNISQPCNVEYFGEMSGRGMIVPLDVPISVVSFGFTKPCDCVERKIQLINESKVFGISIDSIYINDENILNPYPELFEWESDLFNNSGSAFPFQIPALNRDTLRIKFCPKGIFNKNSLDKAARIWIKAKGNGWEGLYNVYLSGKMVLLFESNNKIIDFNPTRVDTFAAPRFTEIKIPEIEYNPNQESVIIDSISFEPDDRVFFASINGNNNFPVILDSEDSLSIKVDFKPRSVRNYYAKMIIHYNKPCIGKDTTISISGSGYAPAFGLSFNFENKRPLQDTLRFITCDTLIVPVYSSRKFPANVVDIKLRLGYDTTKIEFIACESIYLADTCKPHIPSISHNYSEYGGSEFLLKNICSVDSIRPIFYAKFISKLKTKDTLDITLDSISFDTEDVILFNIVAANDYGKIVILQPQFDILNYVDFDSVQVLDCIRKTFTILNNGDVPLSIDDYIGLFPEIKIISSNPPLGTIIQVGDSVITEIEFCPQKSAVINNNILTISDNPCFVTDSVTISGIGFAPEFPVRFDMSYNFDSPDTLNYSIGDTVIVTIHNEKDFSAVRNGITYNIMELDFGVDFVYNARTLKLLSVSKLINGEMKTNYAPGIIQLSFLEVDSLKRGEIAEIKFLAVIPDSIVSTFEIIPKNFSTDSIMFLDIIPVPTYGYCISNGNCGLSYLSFTNNIHILNQNFPNPWTDYTEIKFSIMEKVPVYLDLYDISGMKIMTMLDGNIMMLPGEYSVTINSDNLLPGVYFYTIKAGIFTDYKKMILLK